MHNRRKFGWKPSLPDQKKPKYAAHKEMAFRAGPFVSSVDLRSQMSPIEDQGQLGTCEAHATAAELEFLEKMELKAGSGGQEVFPDNQFDPMSRLYLYWNSCAIDGDAGQDNGTTRSSMMKGIEKWGICREKLWPYDPMKVSVPPPAVAYKEGAQHLIVQDYSIDNTVIDQLKMCLMQGYPFIIGISVYDSFMSEEVAQTGMVPMPQPIEELLGGHAMCCVGYDDTKDCFLVRNSWGIDWGIAGYCWIPYGYLTNADLASDFGTIRKA
jgi:C1A family cysteine protease